TTATIAATTAASMAPVLTPWTPVLQGTAAGDAGQERGLSGVAQRKHASRLFLVSLASRGSEGELLGQIAAAAAAEDGSGGDGDNMEGLSITASFDGADDIDLADTAQDVKISAAFNEQQYDKKPSLITTDGAMKGVHQVAMSPLVSPSDLMAAPPSSLDWPQLADSPMPLPASALTPSGQNLRRSLLSSTAGAVTNASGASQLPSSGGGGGGTSGILRSLVRQHVSIADSMELEATSTGVNFQMWQRRPGRFEMAGSESSSFVFGDDLDRFDMLRMLRAHEMYLKEEAARQLHHDDVELNMECTMESRQ
ncbi:hypothetical protein VaNZ11_009188, partial [Volvox africanus]